MSWASPILGVSAVVIFLVGLQWRRRKTLAAWITPRLPWSHAPTATLRLRVDTVRRFSLWAVLLLWAVALARPQVTLTQTNWTDPGRDWILVMDVSSSMGRIEPGTTTSRWEIARAAVEEFAEKREHDRVGLLTFARFARLVCPLTSDYQYWRQRLHELAPVPGRSPEDGTAIGVALAEAAAGWQSTNLSAALPAPVTENSAARMLSPGEEDLPARPRVVVLLTDGQNNVNDIEPYEGAWLCQQNAVRVHVVSLSERSTSAGGTAASAPNTDVLAEIAKATGGAMFRATRGQDLASIYTQIDQAEPSRARAVERRAAHDWFPTLAASGVVLLLVASLLEHTWLRAVVD